MTKWKRWRREKLKQVEHVHGEGAAWLEMYAAREARYAAQPPRHPIHQMLTMRWAFRWAGASPKTDKAEGRGISPAILPSTGSIAGENKMKLLYCPGCGDCVTMREEAERSCQCGACSGRYVGNTKMVVSGPDVQVLAFRNDKFMKVMQRAVTAEVTAPSDDYHLKANEFPAWVFGPNALAVTKATEQTPRDVRELAATKTVRYMDDVTRVVDYIRHKAGGQQFLADVQEELARLAPLGRAIEPVK